MTNPTLITTVAYTEPNSMEVYNYAIQQNELKLEFHCYDYGARFYGAALGKFTTFDPLSDNFPSWTPYHYVHNNPIALIDPTGMAASPYFDVNGNFLGVDENGYSGDVYVTDTETFKANSEDGVASSKDIQSSEKTEKLQESDGVSAEGYSNIYTHVLNAGGYNTSKMSGGRVAVKTTNGSSNDPSPNVRYLSTKGGGKPNFKISVNQNADDVKLELTTVENIQNSMGAHEYKGHGIQGYSTKASNHYKAYQNQINDPTWSKTTPIFQSRSIYRYSLYLSKENPSLYRKEYPKLLKYFGK